MSVYDDTDFDISDMTVVWMATVRCKLSPAEGTIFYNLLHAGGWIETTNLNVNLRGQKIESEDLPKLIATHMTNIRRKLAEAEIPIVIDNQRTSLWMRGAYRFTYEADQ